MRCGVPHTMNITPGLFLTCHSHCRTCGGHQSGPAHRGCHVTARQLLWLLQELHQRAHFGRLPAASRIYVCWVSRNRELQAASRSRAAAGNGSAVISAVSDFVRSSYRARLAVGCLLLTTSIPKCRLHVHFANEWPSVDAAARPEAHIHGQFNRYRGQAAGDTALHLVARAARQVHQVHRAVHVRQLPLAQPLLDPAQLLLPPRARLRVSGCCAALAAPPPASDPSCGKGL